MAISVHCDPNWCLDSGVSTELCTSYTQLFTGGVCQEMNGVYRSTVYEIRPAKSVSSLTKLTNGFATMTSSLANIKTGLVSRATAAVVTVTHGGAKEEEHRGYSDDNEEATAALIGAVANEAKEQKDADQVEKDNDVEEVEEIVEDEKEAMVKNVLQMMKTLEELEKKVENVKEGNMRMKVENEAINNYIVNMMANTEVFQDSNIG